VDAAPSLSSPFDTGPVDEVPLERAPLARVLAQVRFPRLAALSIGDDRANQIVVDLQEDYPVLQVSSEVVTTLTPQGMAQQPGPGRTWQLQDGDQKWQVTYAPDFVALQTSVYVSRDDFVERLSRVVTFFTKAVHPPRTERIGVRYINQLDEPHIKELPQLIRAEMLGGLAVPASNGVTVARSLSDAQYNLPSSGPGVTDGLQVRWGQIPPGVIIDPSLAATDTPTWILDLDSFRIGQGEFSPSAISSAVLDLADRAYRFFRWVVKDDFLQRFGANK
jgi:uncharacterized protein (TIGR04255 family)